MDVYSKTSAKIQAVAGELNKMQQRQAVEGCMIPKRSNVFRLSKILLAPVFPAFFRSFSDKAFCRFSVPSHPHPAKKKWNVSTLHSTLGNLGNNYACSGLNGSIPHRRAKACRFAYGAVHVLPGVKNENPQGNTDRNPKFIGKPGRHKNLALLGLRPTIQASSLAQYTRFSSNCRRALFTAKLYSISLPAYSRNVQQPAIHSKYARWCVYLHHNENPSSPGTAKLLSMD